MYRNMNGIIQRNTSKIHPVSDFHTLIDESVSKLPLDQSQSIIYIMFVLL